MYSSSRARIMDQLDRPLALCVTVVVFLILSASTRSQESNTGLNQPPDGFQALFNGKNLDGWWGESTTNPRSYMNLPSDELKARKRKSLEKVRKHWRVEDGILINDGKGPFLTTDRFFGDFELRLEFKIKPGTDSGIYLRGIPQVQIWDYTEGGGKSVGSGGLWNNPGDWPGKDPSVRADNPPGEWNEFRIFMVGERVTVFLNGKRIVDHARMNNFYDRKTSVDRRKPVPRRGPIQLQTHGGETRWRNVFLRKIGHREANEILRKGGVEKKDETAFTPIFNGKNLDGWTGAVAQYEVVDGAIQCKQGKGGNLYTSKTYGDFAVQMEFQLPPAGNNGLAIRYPGQGRPAYAGMCEIQVLDNTAEKYQDLDPRQFHGSVYAQWPAHRGYLRETGEWNFQQVTVDGSNVKVELNGTTILQKDISTIEEFMHDAKKFKGRDRKKGHFGFAGHNDPVAFRKIRIRELP